MSKTVNAQKVTDFLKFLVEYYGEFHVNKLGTVVVKSAEEKDRPVQIQREGKDYSLRLFQDPVPKGSFWLLNPFANTLKTTPELGWFYRNLMTSLIIRLLMAVRIGMSVTLSEKGVKVKESDIGHVEVDSRLKDLLTGTTADKKTVYDEVDERMLSEVTSLMGHKSIVRHFLTLGYSAANISCHAHVTPFKSGESWYEEETGIKLRKKTIRVIERLVRNFLDADTDEAFNLFDAVAGEGESPRLSAWLRCYAKLCRQLDPVFSRLLPGVTGNIDALETWLTFLPAMSSRAKFTTGGFHDTVEATEMTLVSSTAEKKASPAAAASAPQQRAPIKAPSLSLPRAPRSDSGRSHTGRLFEEESRGRSLRVPAFEDRRDREPRLFAEARRDTRDDRDRGPSLFSRGSSRGAGPRMPSFR